MEEELVVFALQIRAARAVLGWKQADLARLTGLAQPSIARIEKGNMIPRMSTVTKIRSVFRQHGVEVVDNSPQGGFTLQIARPAVAAACKLMADPSRNVGSE